MANDDYMVHKSFYGSGHDEYNFPLDIMKDSSDILQLVRQAKKCDSEEENGAVLLITENQYIMSYNRGMGRGPHDSTLARIYADITDQKELNFYTIKKYCRMAEQSLIHARVYSEKDTVKVKNILSFSFNREHKISPLEYDSFLNFYNEYAWVFKREKFDVSFAGKTMSIDDIKLLLESMVDYDFSLPSEFSENETIIGEPTNKKEINQNVVK